jgi:homoserine O-acetyltransferase
MDPRSVGIVEKQFVTFADPPGEMPLQSGASLGPITLAYETYGQLNETRSNAVMVCHALSGSSHAAGYYPEEEKPGWWDNMIGPGKAIDTDKYFVVCPNIIGSCFGSTGPGSIDPRTGRPYGLRFPLITIADVVRTEKMLADLLGIQSLLSVIGGSIGGMQALEWAAAYPGMVRSVIPIASTCKRSALSIGLCEAQRQAIMADPDWNNGDYYDREPPRKGLALARIIGHITYLSEASMQRKFGRRLQDNAAFKFDFTTDFQVESYLHHQGKKFVDQFDANSYLYITKAADYFDLGEQRGDGSLVRAFSRTTAKSLVVAFSSDWLFPTSQSKEMVRAMTKAGRDVSFCEIDADYGHDSFLLAEVPMSKLISGFLARIADEEGL